MNRAGSLRRPSPLAIPLVLVVAGAAGASCNASDPVLPADPNPVVVTAAAPPPISGGTLLLTSGGLAVAADSERDQLYVVDLDTRSVTTIALQAGDEPGRLVEDGAGRIHVALRRAGAVATVDLATSQVLRRTSVCSAPRGVAYDSVTSSIYVACGGGELVTLPAAGGAPTRSIRVADRDLRDVLVSGKNLYVTRLRSAEVLTLDASGSVIARTAPVGVSDPSELGASFAADVAWRAIASSSGAVHMVHELAANSVVTISKPGSYGTSGSIGGCSGEIVQTAFATFFDSKAIPAGAGETSITGASVPVDFAEDGLGDVVIASAGSDALFVLPIEDAISGQPCVTPRSVPLPGQPVAVTYAKQGYIAQIRELSSDVGSGPALVISDGLSVKSTIPLPGASMANTGHYLFHHNASATSALACASCHPEGHEDGHVWVFDTLGERRTPTVSGGVLDTAPLHWGGDMSDLTDIMHEVFERRMGGDPSQAGPLHIEAFADWLETIPAYAPSPSGTPAQIAHGQQLFASAGCDGCHSGVHFTNNRTLDVGTGAAFQVPTLVGVAARAPYMHDGCAATLADRFDPTQASCNGGPTHGNVASLSQGDVADLISYLETL